MPIHEISWNGESDGASDLANNPALADFKDVNGLAKAFVDTKAMMGQSVRIPSKDAGADDMKAFHDTMIEKVPSLMPTPDMTDDASVASIMKKLGMPEKHDKYEMPEVEGWDVSDERKTFLQEKAYEAGFTNNQFKKFVKDLAVSEKAGSDAFDSEVATGMAALQTAWGAAYTSKMEQVYKIAEATGAPKDLLEAITAGVAGADTLKWLDGLVKAVGSEDFQVSTQKPGSGGITPIEARERASELRNKIGSMNQSSPEYDSTIKRIMEFDQMAKAS